VTATALITGATGGLGRALCRALKREGVRVVGLSQRRRDAPDCDTLLEGDVSSIAWDDIIAGCDVVFHLAAYVHKPVANGADLQRVVAVNTQATNRLAESCERRGIHLVFASSVAAFDAETRSSATPYAHSKLAAERAIAAAGKTGLRYSSVRFPLLYGPHGHGNMERMLRAIYRRRYWPIDSPNATKSCLFFADAADALIRAWRRERAMNRTLTASPTIAPTLGAIHQEAYAAFGRPVPWPAIPNIVARLGAGVIDSAGPFLGRPLAYATMIRTLTSPAAFDGSAFADATDFAPQVPLSLGMRQTAEWITSSGA
jgi:UDP-glucose 4-epimerase